MYGPGDELLENSGGLFLVHAVGWVMEGNTPDRLLAETEEQLANGERLWDALRLWEKKAMETEEELIYVYAHNGSKFDAIPVIYSVLLATEEPVEDILESNGRFISFRWKHLMFQKLFPHCYFELGERLQGLRSSGNERFTPACIPTRL